MPPSIVRILSLALIGCLGWVQPLAAQNCGQRDTIVFMPNSSAEIQHIITDYFNNDLSDPMQGLCRVEVGFVHQFVENFELRITSPAGQSVSLIGPNGGSTFDFTPGTLWNIGFVPCADVARPDSAFTARWDNDQTENWRPFGRYNGSYYPFMGCLEDFDTGSVNGTWTFSITNNPSSNAGAITYIRLVFCDSRGVTCCFTEPGNWRNAPITACEGAASLDIQPSFSFPFGEAEPGEYGFAYLLGRSGVYQEIVPTPDLRNQPPGAYQVCGFSYRRTELDAFPVPDGQLTIAALRTNLNGLTPVACAELSPTCLSVTIVAPPDTTRLDERICRGDSIVVGGVAFRETGFYTSILPGFANCDSVVTLDLSVIDVPVTNLTPILCPDESITVGTNTYTATGIYRDTLTTAELGCDSIVVLNLTVLSPQQTTLSPVICQGEAFMVGDSLLRDPGVYDILLQSVAGCDSLVTVNLSVLAPLAQIIGDTLVNCNQPEVVLDARTSTPLSELAFTWLAEDGNVLGNDPTWTVTGQGLYTLLATQTQAAVTCTERDSIRVVENFNTPTADPGTALPITCTRPTVVLGGPLTSQGSNYTYTWTTPNGQFAGPTNTPTATVDRPGDYDLLVRDTISFCSATTRVTIGIDTLHPTVVALPDAVLDCSAPAATLNASAAVLPGLDATWAGPCLIANTTAGIAQVDCAGGYVLTLTDTENGCTSTDTVMVTANTTPPTATLLPPDTLTCLRTEVTLDGTGSMPAGLLRFEWSAPAQATQLGSATTSQPGLVRLVVERTDNFCRDTISLTVVQDTLSPMADAGADVVLNCYAGSSTVGGSNTAQGPFFRYQWWEEGAPIPGATANTLVVSQSANLRLEVTDLRNGCVDSDEVAVTEDFLTPEQVEAGPNALLNCVNDLVQLLPDSTRFGQPVTWAWSGPCVDTVPGVWALSTNCPGIYTLTVTNVGNGCSGQNAAEVGVSETFSQAVLVPNATLSCETGMATLDNSGTIGTLYSWLRGGEVVSLPNTSPTVSQPGLYTLIVSDFENICSDTAQIAVAWECEPMLVLSPVDTLTCTRQSVVLSVDESPLVGEHTYEWTAPAGGCFVGDNTAAQVEVVCAGTYQLTVRHTLSGQSSTTMVAVVVDTLAPVVDAGMNQQITCTDTIAHLTASVVGNLEDYRFMWMNFAEEPLAQGATFSTQTGGTYFLMAENISNGCVGQDAVQVTINNAAPTISFGSTVFPCTQDTFRLRAFVSPLLAGNRYQWSGPGILADADSTGVLVNTAGDYTLQVERTDNGCTATATAAVTQQSCVPCLSLPPADTLDCVRTEVLLQAAFCEPCPDCTLQWSDANGDISGADELTLQVDAPGTYRLTATDVSGFQSTVTAQVLQFNTFPALDLGDDRNLTCDSTTVQLAHTGGALQAGLRYEWRQLEDPAFVRTDTTLTTGVAGTFVLTLFDAVSGCTARDTVVVGIDTLPPVAEAGPNPLLTCTTSAVVLDGSGSTLGGAIYEWTGPDAACLSGANTLNPLATCAGLYTLRVTRPNGCIAEDTVRVTTADELPLLMPLPDAVLTCAVPSVTLLADPVAGGGNYDYRWCPVNALGEDISNLCSIGLGRTVAQPGRFRFTATNTLTSCSSNFIVQVSIDTLAPTVDAGMSETLLCNATQLLLNATAESGSYLWSDADGNPLAGGSTLMPTVSAPGWYYLSVIAADNGCSGTDSVFVAQDVRTPMLDAGADTLINCAHPTLVLSATGSVSGNAPQWQWTTPDGSITQNATTPQPTVAAAGTYIVRLTDPATGCATLDTLVVGGDFASPQAIVADADLLVLDCRQDTLLLDALASVGSTGQPLVWAWVALGTGRLFPSTDTPQVFTDRPGSYRLVVEDTGNGCRDTLLLNVASDRQTPTTVVQTPAVLDCQTASVTLLPQVPASTDGYLFRWLDANGGLLGDAFTQTVTAAGWYFLEVENIRNGCTSTDSVQVASTIERPGVAIVLPQAISCANASVLLDGTASVQGVDFSYQWTTPDGTLEGNTQSPTATAAAPGNYTLTVLNTENGCDSSATVTVLASGTFITGVTLDTVQPNCLGEQLGSIGVSAVAGGTPPYQYRLSGTPFSVSPFFEDLPIGTYTLTVRDGAGCIWVQEVGIVAPATLTLDLGPDVTIQSGDSITLRPKPSHPVSSWRWVALPSLLGGQAPLVVTVAPQESQYVVLTAVDEAGCTAADTLRITVEKRRRIFLPDAFSPNGDGNNDTFTVFADQEVAIVNHLRIFNRWGGMVFERTDFAPNNPALGWDGLLDGQPLNTAVFVYSLAVTYRDGRTEWLTGEMVLMR